MYLSLPDEEPKCFEQLHVSDSLTVNNAHLNFYLLEWFTFESFLFIK